MDFLAHIPVRALWLLAAAGCVVAGAPLFAMGRRTLRLRQVLAGLAERPLGSDHAGVALVRGRVSLESPRFAPLSGKPCAGYTLEVSGQGMRVGDTIHELRPFRLTSDGVTARVVPEGSRWRGPVTSERMVAPGEELPGRLSELLATSAESRWLRDRRVPLRLVERALEIGAQVYVTGTVHGFATVASVETLELAATGTDDIGAFVASGHELARASLASGHELARASVASGHDLGASVASSHELAGSGHDDPAPAPGAGGMHPGLWIEPSESFEQVLVTPEAPSARTLVPPAWRLAFLALGPITTMLGFLYLVRAAAPLVAGRF